MSCWLLAKKRSALGLHLGRRGRFYCSGGTRMRRGGALGLGAMAILGVIGASQACGSDETSSPSNGSTGESSGTKTESCIEDPFRCADGETCWIKKVNGGPQAECLKSGRGKDGDDCQY